MTVRQILTPLVRQALTRLCRQRELKVSGTRDQILERLARSYRGNFSAVMIDLRRRDLLNIARALSDDVEFPTGLSALPVTELREVCLTVFEDRYEVPEAPVGKAIEDDEEEEQQLERAVEGGFDVVLHATGCGVGPGEGHVNEESLAELAADADSVTILSAYYVPDVLRVIAGACRGDVKIVLNGLGGKRLNEQTKELKALQETLRKRSQSAEVRLAFAEGIFHTKLYLFGRESGSVAWIGSANATEAGLNGRNEEVLVRVTPVPDSVLAYVDSAWSRAMPVECDQGEVNSLIAFFRTGMLYYKPDGTLPWTINPFLQLVKRLPQEEKRKIAVFQSEFADDEAGIGAFNLNLMFERTAGEGPVEQQRVTLRRHAIQTCYGHWVAEPFIEHVAEMLIQASANKRSRLKAISQWMKTDRDAIVDAYLSYLGDVRRMLDEEEVDWRVHAPQDQFENASAIEGRVDSLLAVLGTEHRLARHCEAFIPSQVPEIWEDDAACTMFLESFFDSLAYAWSAQRRDGSAKLILESLAPFLKFQELSHEPAQTIKTVLEAALGSEGWYEDHFRRDGQA